MSQAKVKATKLKAARASKGSQSTFLLSQQQVLVEDGESHNFRLGDTTTQQGSTIMTVFHIKESKYDIEKRIIASRLPYIYNPMKRFADTSLYRQVLPIPLRPGWNNYSTREELQQNEKEKFDEYLNIIYKSIPPSRLTHFEHNLDVWRQLWRVSEISDVLCACVDARHPLFHFPPALYDFITKKLKKPLILILNKIDLVPKPIIIAWEKFLQQIYPDIHIIKFSSHPDPITTQSHQKPADESDETQNGTNIQSFLTDDSIRLTKGMSVQANGGKQTGAGAVKKYEPIGSALLKTFWNIMTFIVENQSSLPKSTLEQLTTPNTTSIVTNQLVSFALDYSRRIGAENGDAPNNIEYTPQFTLDLGHLVIPKSVLVTEGMEAEEKNNKNNTINNGTTTNNNNDDKVMNNENVDVEEVKEQLRLLELASRDDSDDESTNNKNNKKISHKPTNNIESESNDNDEMEAMNALSYGNDLTAHQFKQKQKISLTIGMVGHPNAGKSSLINAILGRAAVSVSNTPGHTKHLQTLTTIPNCSTTIRLCDSPGIVFPAVDISRSLQTLLGIFPHPKLAEPYTCVQFLAERLPLVNIYQLKPYFGSKDSDAILNGASHPGGDSSAFIDNFQDFVLKTKYNGAPTIEETTKNLFSIPSNQSHNIHAVFVDGIVTSTNPTSLGAEQNSNSNQTANTTNAPILVNGIDISTLAPPSKSTKNNKNNNNKNKSTPNQKQPKNQSLIQPNANQTQNDLLFDSLDKLLTDSKFDQFTNPRFVWSAYRICESYAVKRAWYTESSGKPDTFKAGMSIIKDCVDGRLNLYFLPPRVQQTTQNQD